MRAAEGLLLGGRYELRSRLAVGGMGEVWLTRDLSLGRSVATKVLRPELAGDVRFVTQLRAEACTSAALSHPNIATLYDYGEDDDGAGYLVMELVSGQPLSRLLARERTLRAEALLPILAQAARALHAAHVLGVVHRDVKPSNILLTRDGRVKITDFGVSVSAGTAATDPHGTVLGTVHYLAPELVLGHPASPASDLYALGVVAFEAAIGRRPFTGDDVAVVARAHVHSPIPDLGGDLPAALVELVHRMLAKNPAQRPRSAAAAARRIERVQRELELVRPFDEADGDPERGANPEPAVQDGLWAGRHVAASFATKPVVLPDLLDHDHDRHHDHDHQHGALGHPVRPPGRPRRRLGRPRWWQAFARAADAIAAGLGLAAYRLTASVTTSRGGAAVLWLEPARTVPTLVGDGGRAEGNAPRHQTEVEDSSW